MATTDTRKPGTPVEFPEGTPQREVDVTESVQADYFGTDERYKVFLPDGKSYVEHQKLNEGARRKYLNKINREVSLDRKSGNAKIATAPGDETKELLEVAVVDWNLKRGGQPVQFDKNNFNVFLNEADPTIIDLVVKDIREKNRWLITESRTSDEIQKDIDELEELKKRVQQEEEAKNS